MSTKKHRHQQQGYFIRPQDRFHTAASERGFLILVIFDTCNLRRTQAKLHYKEFNPFFRG